MRSTYREHREIHYRSKLFAGLIALGAFTGAALWLWDGDGHGLPSMLRAVPVAVGDWRAWTVVGGCAALGGWLAWALTRTRVHEGGDGGGSQTGGWSGPKI